MHPLFPGHIVEKALQLLRGASTPTSDAFDDRLPAAWSTSVSQKRPGLTFFARAETGRGTLAASSPTTQVVENMTENQILDGRRPVHFDASAEGSVATTKGEV